MAIAGLLGAGMRAAGGAMVKSGARGMTKGLIGRRGKKAQQQQQNDVQQVDVKVVDSKPQTGNQISSMSSFLSLPSAKKIGSGGAKGISGVEEKLNLIKSLFAERFAYAKDKSRQDEMEKDRQRKEKREKELEKEENKAKRKVKSKSGLPRIGLFDSIRNFIFYTFLAFLEKRFNFSQMLVKALPVILNVGKFIIDIGGKILDGLATFVDFGYGLVDKTKEFIKFVGGDFALNAFEKAIGAINHVMNLLFIYAMAQAAFDFNIKDFLNFKKGAGAAKGVGAAKGTAAAAGGSGAAGTAGSVGGVAASTAAAVIAGVGLLSSALGEGAFQLRKIGKGLEEGAKKRYEEKAFYDPRKPIDFLLYQGARFINHNLNGLGVLLDIVGAPFRYAVELINFGVMSIFGDTEGMEKQRKNLAKFDARVREGIRQLLNVATLGFGFQEKGSFGNLFGDEEATKEMVGKMQNGGVVRRYKESNSTAVQAKSKGGIVHLVPGYEEGGSVEEDVQKKPLKKDKIRISEPQPTVSGRFDMEDNQGYINNKPVSLEEYQAFSNMSSAEKAQTYGMRYGGIVHRHEEGGSVSEKDLNFGTPSILSGELFHRYETTAKEGGSNKVKTNTIRDDSKVQAKSKGGIVHRYEEGGSVEGDVQKKLLKKDKIRISEPLLDEKKGRGLSKILGKDGEAAADYVRQSGEAFSKVPIIGPVLALAADKILGNTTDPNAFQAISNALTNFSTLSASGETKSSGDYEKFTTKYNVGGEVQASSIGLSDPMETSRSLGRFLNTKFNAITLPGEGVDVKSGSKKEKEETKEGSTAGPGSAAGQRDSATGALTPGSQTGTAPGTATGAVAASDLYTEIGADAQQWDLFRNTVALIESGGKYDIFGGSGDHYDGRYQMGEAAKIDGSRLAGVEYPGHSDDPNNQARAAYRANPELQETIFTAFTVANHRYLMGNETYASAGVERKLEILGYAHNQGMGGAEKWMTTGEVGADGFGTKGTKYTDMIAANFRAQKSGGELQIAEGAVDVPSLAPTSSPGADTPGSGGGDTQSDDSSGGDTSVGGGSIVAIGKDLVSKGFAVAEHPDFTKQTPSGSYTPGAGSVSNVHKGKGHYEGRAIDVTNWRGGDPEYKQAYLPILDSLASNDAIKMLIHDTWGFYKDGSKSGPGSYGHPQHMHIETKMKGGGLIGKSTKQYGDISTKASYEKTGSRVMVQPIIIEKQAPQENFMMNPMDKLTFAGRGRLNNTPAFSRG